MSFLFSLYSDSFVLGKGARYLQFSGQKFHCMTVKSVEHSPKFQIIFIFIKSVQIYVVESQSPNICRGLLAEQFAFGPSKHITFISNSNHIQYLFNKFCCYIPFSTLKFALSVFFIILH